MKELPGIAVVLGLTLVAAVLAVPLARAAPTTRIAIDPCLDRLIGARLQESPGTFAVAAVDATTLRGAIVDGERLFYGASLYKLWILESVYRAVEAGHMHWGETIAVSHHEEPKPTPVPGATATPLDPSLTPVPVPTRPIEQGRGGIGDSLGKSACAHRAPRPRSRPGNRPVARRNR